MTGPLNRYGDVHRRSLSSVNVLDHGAVLNGIADDTESLYRAEAKLPAYGGNIIVPWGSLRTTAPFIPKKPNIVISAGASRNAQNASVLGTQADGPGMIYADFAGPAIVLDSQYNINGFGMHDITMAGTRAVGGRAIQFLTSTTDFRREFLFRAVTMTRFDMAIVTDVASGYPAGNDKSWGVIRIKDSKFTNNRWISKNINGGQWQSFIFANNDAGQNGYQTGEGGLSLAAHNLSIIDNILEGQRDPISVIGAYRSLVVSNNYFEACIGTACIDIASAYSVDIGPNFFATTTTDYDIRLRHVGYVRSVVPVLPVNAYHPIMPRASNTAGMSIKVPVSTTNPVPVAWYTEPNTRRSWDATTSSTLTHNTAVTLGGVASSAYRQTIAVGGAGTVTQSAPVTAASGQWVVCQMLMRKNSAHSADLKWKININGSTSNALGSIESVANQSRHFLKKGEWVHVVTATRAHAAVTSVNLVLSPYGDNPTHTADITADVTRMEVTVVDNVGDILAGVALPAAL